MVFNRENCLSIAFFVPKKEYAVIRKEDARKLAMQELISQIENYNPKSLNIEAFENSDGWMIFANTSEEDENAFAWYRFSEKEDFLDLLSCKNFNDIQGWEVADGSFISLIKGTKEDLCEYKAILSEFAEEFDAPELMSLHLTEQKLNSEFAG